MSNPSGSNNLESKVAIENGAYANPAFVGSFTEPNNVKLDVDEGVTYSKPYWSQSVVCRVVAACLLLSIIAGFITMLVCMSGNCGRWGNLEETGKCSTFEIVSRDDWGAREPNGTPTQMTSAANMTTLHHTEGRNCTDQATCMEYVRLIQDYHMDDKGWNDIGYNFLVGEDGRVYEGRGWQIVGAHSPTYNSMSHGISIIGTFHNFLPLKKATDTAKELMDCGIEKGHIQRNYELFGHRDGRCTDCPGDALYGDLRNWPHYSYREIPVIC